MIISLRPLTFRFFCVNIMQDEKIYAGVAELANALDLGSSGALLAGSSPVARTKQKSTLAVLFLLGARDRYTQKLPANRFAAYQIFKQ